MPNIFLSLLGLIRKPAAYSGYVDCIRDGQLHGWAARKGRHEPILIDVTVDGQCLFENVKADLFRQDLADAGVGTGAHGFSIPIEPEVFGNTADFGLYLSGTDILIAKNSNIAIESSHPDDSDPLAVNTGSAVSGHSPSETVARISNEAEMIRPFFQDDYYREQLDERGISTSDPLEHYLLSGWKADLDPSQDFSTSYYLNSNPDVAGAGVNPFWHYIAAGRSEKRRAQAPGGYKTELLAQLEPLEITTARWRKSGAPPEIMSARQLLASIRQQNVQTRRPILVSLSHDNYMQSVGGVQLCIHSEQIVSQQEGIDYLNIHPWQALPVLAGAHAEHYVSIVLNGTSIGSATTSGLLSALGQLHDQGTEFQLVIHSLLGHAPEVVIDLAERCGIEHGWFWLHDYLSICPSYSLQRNGVTFCGAPPSGSQACGICIYGEERGPHLRRMHNLFDAISFTVLSPSQTALVIWQAATSLPHDQARVIPHLTLCDAPPAPARQHGPEHPIRIAYVGYITPQKGWSVFRELVHRLRRSGRFEFHYFGTSTDVLQGVTEHSVSVSANDRDAMARALADAEIDIVLLWASGPETFSFTAHEAIAAGATIITSPVSGNVATLIEDTGAGVVLPDENSLLDFFNSGAASTVTRLQRRSRSGRPMGVTFSQMTFSVLNSEVDL